MSRNRKQFNCTPEEFIEQCRQDISRHEACILELQYEIRNTEMHNRWIDITRNACDLAYIGIFIFDALLYMTNHWIWLLIMLLGGNVIVYEIVHGIDESLTKGKYKKSIHCFHEQIAEEQKAIEKLNEYIKEVENIINSSGAAGDAQQRNQNKSKGGNGTNGDSQRQRQNQGNQKGASASDMECCYKILYCSPDASDDEVKSMYRKLAKEYHPDRVSATGLGEHIIRDAEEKLKLINEAYHKIMASRGKAK